LRGLGKVDCIAERRAPRETRNIQQEPPWRVRDRVPSGQFVTDKFPVLTFGPSQRVDTADWRLRVFGLVETERAWTWEEFLALAQVTVKADFHCVTQWSRLDNTWQGVPFRDVMRHVKPLAQARHVMVHCYGGYTANLALSAVMEDDVLLAHRHDGEPLAPDHGGPMRLIVPQRYAWKSAKWVSGLELLEDDSAGFWERRGYHMRGDPWREERFWPELS